MHPLTGPERLHALRIARLGPTASLASSSTGIDAMRSYLVEACRVAVQASQQVVNTHRARQLTDRVLVEAVDTIVDMRMRCQAYTAARAEADARLHLAANPRDMPPETPDEDRRARVILIQYPRLAAARADADALAGSIRDRLHSQTAAARIDSILRSIEDDLSRDEKQVAHTLHELAYAVDAHEPPAPNTVDGLGLLRGELRKAIQGVSCNANRRRRLISGSIPAKSGKIRSKWDEVSLHVPNDRHGK